MLRRLYPMGDPMVPVVVVDRVEGRVAVVEYFQLDLGSGTPGEAQTLEVPKGSWRAGQVYAHDGKRWRRSVPLERWLLAQAQAQLGALPQAPKGNITIHPPAQQVQGFKVAEPIKFIKAIRDKGGSQTAAAAESGVPLDLVKKIWAEK